MQSTGIKFNVTYNDGPVEIELFLLKKTEIYKATSANGNVLFLTHGRHVDGDKFWTSMPEGKQELAERIGALIDSHQKPASLKPPTPPKPSNPPPSQTSLF